MSDEQQSLPAWSAQCICHRPIRHRVGTEGRWMPRRMGARWAEVGGAAWGAESFAIGSVKKGHSDVGEEIGVSLPGFLSVSGFQSTVGEGPSGTLHGCWGATCRIRAAQDAPCPQEGGPGPWLEAELWLWGEVASASMWRRPGSLDLTAPVIESAGARQALKLQI